MGDTAFPSVSLLSSCVVIFFCVWVSSLVYPPSALAIKVQVFKPQLGNSFFHHVVFFIY